MAVNEWYRTIEDGLSGHVRAGSLTDDRWHWYINCISSGPHSHRSSLFPNAIMPAHRHPQTARSHAGRPYKASIIVISSDEEEEHRPVSKRGSRKPRRSRAEGEVLEISEDSPVKVEERESEGLRQRCHELKQACSSHRSMKPHK